MLAHLSFVIPGDSFSVVSFPLFFGGLYICVYRLAYPYNPGYRNCFSFLCLFFVLNKKLIK